MISQFKKNISFYDFPSSSRYECRSCKLVFKDFYSMEDHSRSCGNSSIPSGDHSRSCEDRSQPLGDHLRSSGDPSISSFSLLTDSKPDIQRLVYAIRVYMFSNNHTIRAGCIFSQIIRGVNFLKNHFETHFFPISSKIIPPSPQWGCF